MIVFGDRDIYCWDKIVFSFLINSSNLYIYTSVDSAEAKESTAVPFIRCCNPSTSEPDINSFNDSKSVFPRLGDSCNISQNSLISNDTGDICSIVEKLLPILRFGSFLLRTS